MAAAMPAMVAAPVVNVVVMATAMAMPVLDMMMAMTVPTVRFCRRRLSDHQHGQGREQCEAHFCKQFHLITPQKNTATERPAPSQVVDIPVDRSRKCSNKRSQGKARR